MFLYNSALAVKTRQPEDDQLCIAVHILKNVCDTDPLGKQDNKA